MMHMATKLSQMSGWGRYPKTTSSLYRPDSIRELCAIPDDCTQRRNSVVARGLGRSYGDASLNGGFSTVLMAHLDRIVSFNPDTGSLRCEAGLSLQHIIQRLVPLGWFPMVTPGTQFCTVGGAIASDVHGKNHHVDGSFGDHLQRFSIMLPSGEIVECSREQNAPLFWATIGGMGLTGVILDAEFQMRPIATKYIMEDRLRTRDMDETLDAFQQRDSDYPYSVAWIDCLSTGRSFGRGVLLFGDHAKVTDLPSERQANPLAWQDAKTVTVPCNAPGFVLNRLSLLAFNEAYYLANPTCQSQLVGLQKFFHPLDAVYEWNRLYGASGFTQWQCIVPFADGAERIKQILQKVQASRQLPFLSILKRMGKGSGGMLSFPMEGYTLAMDFPIRKGLLPLLDALDEVVVQVGGHLYLAKDARTSPQTVAAMYPRLAEFKQLKAQIDPNGLIQSDLARRTALLPEVVA